MDKFRLIAIVDNFKECTNQKCFKELSAVKENKTASKLHGNALINLRDKSLKKQENYIKKVIANKKLTALFNCNYNNCYDIYKELITIIIKIGLNTPNKFNNDKSFYDELQQLLKAQNLTDNELLKLRKYAMKAFFNI